MLCGAQTRLPSALLHIPGYGFHKPILQSMLRESNAERSTDGLGLTAMIAEDALPGEGRGLGAVANVKLGVEVA